MPESLQGVNLLSCSVVACFSVNTFNRYNHNHYLMKRLNLLFAFAAVAALTFSACSSKPEGEQVESSEAKEGGEATGTAYTVATGESQVAWLGTKTGGQHAGTLPVSQGKLMVDGEELTGGQFTIDMTQMTVTDKELPEEKKTKLKNHLSSGDFFQVDSFPNAKFEITNVMANKTDSTTHNVEGNLTVRGVTKSITIPANVQMKDGMVMAETPKFTINRQDFNVDYEMEAKDMVINDMIQLQIDLKASKAGETADAGMEDAATVGGAMKATSKGRTY